MQINVSKPRLWRVLGVSWILALLIACTPDPIEMSRLDKIQERGVLRIGTLMNPTNYMVRNEVSSGFEYELAQGLAQELDVELEVTTAVDLRELWQLLDSGQVDFLAAGLDVTDDRRERVRFSPAYHHIEQKLVYLQGSRDRPRDWSEVNGKIRVVTQSSHQELLTRIHNLYPHLDWTTTHLYDSDELLEQVMDETVDFTIVDSHHLDIKRRYYPDLSVAFTVRENVPLAWAFPQEADDSLYASAIEYLGARHNSGYIDKLADRYFGHVEEFNYVDTRLFIEAVEERLPEYLPMFQEHAGDLDWRLLAAVSYQESHWNPWARSPTGVRGMMMLTLPTARSVNVRSRLDAEESIRGGSQYLARMKQRIPARIAEPDRTWFALAAYNVGLGHLNDARIITERQGGNPDYWVDVRERLPLLRQKQYYRTTRYGYARGDEPVRYVGNIRRYYDTMRWLDEQGRIPYGDSDSRQANNIVLED
ncbi:MULTISPECIES: membrane-bound lytic murein transglycosylase MltF [Gammaproteobacteria]|uniref:membrane-bound lytic murein transglycosylase MltF n=1 Tax=Gammaproteobacteria TaxID=1236 RepID=UPI000DD03DAD|nr:MULTISPECIES: membrane-bound lytic murein transglycosylase MltF [Gammaproteobacteria]RTE86184.1 membrane-bound lytic murein transglycosylase MltF [Aliidiomarina sp. B3213]TCZ91536.1 membrane-bound lytic murein transglycosylase MltF [Lysobacter sp. N42]